MLLCGNCRHFYVILLINDYLKIQRRRQREKIIICFFRNFTVTQLGSKMAAQMWRIFLILASISTWPPTRPLPATTRARTIARITSLPDNWRPDFFCTTTHLWRLKNASTVARSINNWVESTRTHHPNAFRHTTIITTKQLNWQSKWVTKKGEDPKFEIKKFVFIFKRLFRELS